MVDGDLGTDWVIPSEDKNGELYKVDRYKLL
jgi:hypothetical protein